MVFTKRPSRWSYALTLGLTVLGVGLISRSYNADQFSWYSVVMSGFALLHLPRIVVDQFYIPLIGRLIIDENGIRLDAGRYSWNYDWHTLDCAYIQKQVFGQSVLNLNSVNKVEKVLTELIYWKPETDNEESIIDTVSEYLCVKSYDEMPVDQHSLARDLGPVAAKAAVIIGGALILSVIAGAYIHRYYSLGDGTPTSWWVSGGLLTAIATLFYLFNNYVNRLACALVCVLGFMAGAYSVPVIVKSAVILTNAIEVHEFELIEKNGGYQYWRSRSDKKIEIELGSVNNSIHTENEQGAVLALKLVKGRSMTLLLPDELEKTRYLVK